MTATPAKDEGTARLVGRIEDAGQASLEAVRKFLDTVDGAFPDLGGDDRHRRKIIDSAFKMTEQLVGTASRLAQNVLDETQKTMSKSSQKSAAPRKKAVTPPKAAKATKSAKKTVVTKTAKRSTR